MPKCDVELVTREVDEQSTIGQLVCKVCGRKTRILTSKHEVREAMEQIPECKGAK